MAIIGINLNPTPRELKWFGAIVLVFFALIGGLIFWRVPSPVGALVVWSVGLALALVYYLVPPVRRPLYLGWMHAVFPIGWVVSHLLLGVAYYLILTPIGLAVRRIGGDPMKRRLEPEASSYWIPRKSAVSSDRYFRQY